MSILSQTYIVNSNMNVLGVECQMYLLQILERWVMQAFLFSYQCAHGGKWAAGKGLVRKLEEGIDLVHNKYNTTFLGVLVDHKI